MKFLCSIFFFSLFSISIHASDVDSLLKILEEIELTDQDALYDIHVKLGEGYAEWKQEKYEMAEHYYTIALKLAMEFGDKEKIAQSHFGIALTHQRRNNYKKALVHYYKVIEQFEEKGGEKKTEAFTQLSSIYQALGDYQKAFEYQMNALTIYEKNGDQLEIAHSNYGLGTIFYYQKQYEQSLKHYQKAKEIVDRLKNEKFNYSCVAALGAVYERLGDNEKSLEYNLISLEMAEKQEYKTGIAYAKGNIAMNYLQDGEFARAEVLLKEATSIKHQNGDQYGVIGNGIDLSELYLAWNKPKKAIPVLEKALVIAEKVESKTRRSEIYKSLSIVFDQVSQPIKSHDFLKKHVALKDSLINEKTLEEMGQSKRRYELEIQEQEIAILKKENELLGKNEKIQKLQFYIFSVSSFAFLMFIWWYRNRLRYQRNTNKLLEEKNEKIQVQNVELQYAQDQLLKTNILLEDNNVLLEEKNDLLNGKNEEIRIKNKQLEHSNQDLQQFAYVASHDLKEPLRMINSYTKLLERRYNDLFDESGKEFMFFVTDAVKRMGTLLDDLLDFSRAGTQEAPSKLVALENVMVLVEANLRHRFELLNAKMIVRNENLPSVKAHQTQLLQLLQNLVSNGFKFKGDRDPIVIVDCERREKDYVVSIQDNGIGISEENKKKIFEMFKRLHTREEYEGTGIGLATCKRIVTSWGGDIWLESEVGVGSTFFFSIPVYATFLKTEKQEEGVPA